MKRWLRITLTLAVAFIALPAVADVTPDDLDSARRAFEQARALSDADGGRLWGVELYGPMLLADRASREVVANRPDRQGVLRPRDGLHVGVLPEDVGLANTAAEWAGRRWTMLLRPLPAQRYARGRLLMHELYHRVQGELGLEPQEADNGHLDTRDGRIWLRLEWRALSEALIHRGADRETAIADALLFRALRRRIFPQRADDERRLVLNEGLAEYTGFKLCGLPGHVLADRAAIQIDDYEQRPNFVRSFAYASGPAYGILLDESGISWRSDLSPGSDLGALLRRAHGVELPDDLEAEARRRAGHYGGERVIARETERHEARQARLAEFRRRFVEGPTITIPAAGSFRYTFNPNEVEAFEDVGSVYLSTRATDEWGVLEVERGGALLIRGAGGTRFVLPAPADPSARPLNGDGWTLRLEDRWTLEPGARPGDLVLKRRDEPG